MRQGDNQWADIVRWTLFAMIEAEEYGITQANVDAMAEERESDGQARFSASHRA